MTRDILLHSDGKGKIRRTFVAFVGILVFAVVAAGLLYFHAIRMYLVRETRIRDAAHLGIVSESIVQLLTQGRRNAAFLAQLLRPPEQKGQVEQEAAIRIVDMFQREMKVGICYVIDMTGTTIISSNRADADSFLGKNYQFRPYFIEALAGKSSVYLAMGITSRRPGIYFSAPVRDVSNRVIAVAVINTEVTELIQKESVKNHSVVLALHNQDGMIIEASRPSWLLSLLWPIDVETRQQYEKSKQFGPGPWPSLDFQRISSEEVFSADGTRYFMQNHPLSDLPGWQVVLFHDLGAFDAAVFDLAVSRAGISVALILTPVFLLLFLLYRRALLLENMRVRQKAALLMSADRFSGAFEAAANGMALVSLDGKCIRVNSSLCAIVGYSKDELRATNFRTITHPDDLDNDIGFMRQLLAGELAFYHIEKRFIHKQGQVVWVKLSVSLAHNRDHSNRHLVFQVNDITTEGHDPLTGLMNRRYFVDALERELRRALRQGPAGVLVWLDLDGFKEINDTFGHQAGDEALVFCAETMLQAVRAYDSVGRMGGDEFVLLLPATSVEHGCATVRKIMDHLVEVPFVFSGAKISLEISAGVVSFPGHGQEANALLARADAAMYVSKRTGKGRVTVHDGTVDLSWRKAGG